MSEYDWKYEFKLKACGGCTLGNVNFESIFDWKYAGFTKDHSYNRKYFDEVWIWKCPMCGHEEIRPFGNQNKPKMACPMCTQKTSNSVNGSGEAIPWNT